MSGFIDADTHVDECDETWSYMPASMSRYAPKNIEFAPGEAPEWLLPNRSSGSSYTRFWFIDGRLFNHRLRSDERTGTTVGTRELLDVPARLRDMDEMGVATQVIYPTVFLHEITRRADYQAALYSAYNHWLAERCADSGGRLRWVALAPYRSMDDALKEIRFGKEHGACGVFKIGIECERTADDEYFHPAYSLAQELDLSICIHQASAWAAVIANHSGFPGIEGGMPVVRAAAALAQHTLIKKFPELRFGFIESGSEWLPYVLRTPGLGNNVNKDALHGRLRDLNFFVTCEVSENVGYLVDELDCEDNLVVGTDYCHGDRASVIDAHKQINTREDLDEKVADKITSMNAATLYSL